MTHNEIRDVITRLQLRIQLLDITILQLNKAMPSTILAFKGEQDGIRLAIDLLTPYLDRNTKFDLPPSIELSDT